MANNSITTLILPCYWGSLCGYLRIDSYFCCVHAVWTLGHDFENPWSVLANVNIWILTYFTLHWFWNKLSAYINHSPCVLPGDLNYIHAICIEKSQRQNSLIMGYEPWTKCTKFWCSINSPLFSPVVILSADIFFEMTTLLFP